MSVPQRVDVVVVPLVFAGFTVAPELKPRERTGEGP